MLRIWFRIYWRMAEFDVRMAECHEYLELTLLLDIRIYKMSCWIVMFNQN